MNELLVVVIPNKNGRRHLAYSLPSLADVTYRPMKVVLVDNASADDSVAFVRSAYPTIQLLTSVVDGGFARSVNRGIQWAGAQGARFIAVFSNDIRVLPDAFDRALSLFSHRIGVVGFQEIGPDERLEDVPQPDIPTAQETSHPAGCLYVLDARALKTIGLYDEGYYMYGEDTDLFSRLRRAGYRLVASDVPVWHYNEGYSSSRRFQTSWLAYRNTLRYAIKNESPWQVVRRLAYLVHVSSNPLIPRSRIVNASRLRPYALPINLLMLLTAIAWNVVHLASTLSARRRDHWPR